MRKWQITLSDGFYEIMETTGKNLSSVDPEIFYDIEDARIKRLRLVITKQSLESKEYAQRELNRLKQEFPERFL